MVHSRYQKHLQVEFSQEFKRATSFIPAPPLRLPPVALWDFYPVKPVFVSV